jgi:AbrB family looped-hinge helix DNA binding protein
MRVRATITSKGQVTIPQEVRRRLGLRKGDRIEFVVEDGVTILRPARDGENPFEAYAGSLDGFETKDEVNTWLRELREDESEDSE